METLQVYTIRDEKKSGTLKTRLRKKELRPINPGEILVEMLYVPIHGSFWLATHPHGIHPRMDEFFADDYFVFGNGGVARVMESWNRQVNEGDYVCIFGHVPCNHYDCYACTVLHRYTECDFNEGTILGHGKHGFDGTYSEYAILPESSYELCYRRDENPGTDQLKPFMLGFLFADVRNALTRHIDSLRMRRMLIFGAGYSGLAAAYIHNRTSPESKIFVVDSSKKRLDVIRSINHDSIATCLLPADVVNELNLDVRNPEHREKFDDVIIQIRNKMRKHFKGRGCNILFDCSSGNSAPLWDNPHILSPTTHCIPFGFGSESVQISKELIQMSGLTFMMSRGVGNIRNRTEVIELIKAGASKFINEKMISSSKRLHGIETASEFIRKMHHPPKPIHEIKHAYIKF
jgi:threonine dehydrogenase-like Zn-dependent dehydrogenase